MNIWIIEKKLNGTSLPKKEDFYSHLNMEDNTDADCAHAKKVRKDFERKKLSISTRIKSLVCICSQ